MISSKAERCNDMLLEKKKETKNYYEKYPMIEGGPSRIKWWQEYLEPFLPDSVIRGQLIGDIGSGIGEMSRGLINRGARMVCLDLTLAALRRNREINPEAELFNGSALDLPFADGALDHTISLGVLHHTPDCRKGVKEVARVTSPGGTVVLYIYSYWSLLNLAYSLFRPVTKTISLDAVPDGIVKMLQPFVKSHLNQKLDDYQLRRLLGDKLWTPQCTFHTLGEIKKWAADEGLTMTRYKRFYLGYANVMAFKKDGAPISKPTEELKLRCIECGYSPLSKSEEGCCCEKCGSEFKKEEGIYRFLSSEMS
jgi:ubiquinone/menaquinone biosynthesis C-methylase UbiE